MEEFTLTSTKAPLTARRPSSVGASSTSSSSRRPRPASARPASLQKAGQGKKPLAPLKPQPTKKRLEVRIPMAVPRPSNLQNKPLYRPRPIRATRASIETPEHSEEEQDSTLTEDRSTTVEDQSTTEETADNDVQDDPSDGGEDFSLCPSSPCEETVQKVESLDEDVNLGAAASETTSAAGTPRSVAPQPLEKPLVEPLNVTFDVSAVTNEANLALPGSSSTPVHDQVEQEKKSDNVKHDIIEGFSSAAASSVSSCTLSVASSTADCDIERNSDDEFNNNDGDDESSASPGGYGDVLKAIERMEMEEASTAKGDESRLSSTTFDDSTAKVAGREKQKSTDETENTTVKKLFSFLDDVERETSQFVTPTPTTPVTQEQKSVLVLAKQPSLKLAERLVKANFKLEEEERAVTVLRKALDQQRKASSAMTAKFEKEMEHRTAQQRNEYESTVKRHQSFIDQLIEDKRQLSERCDHLHMELRNAERRHQETLRAAEQRHAAEVRRLRSLQEASSRIKQEKWVDEKTKRIKEQTVRGLEPEVARLMSRHSAELTELSAERDRALAGQERELQRRHHQHVRELRDLWEEELAEAVGRERQALIQRHGNELQRLAEEREAETARLEDTLRRERRATAAERQAWEEEAARLRRATAEAAEAEASRVRQEEELKRRVLSKKHAAELASLKESENVERSSWERDFRQKMDKEWEAKEAALLEKAAKERSTEAERNRKAAEEEMERRKAAVDKEAEEKLARMRAKLDEETREMETECQRLRAKATESRERAAKLEEELTVAKTEVRQRETALQALKETNSHLEAEREDVRGSVRQEFVLALESLRADRGRLLDEVSKLRQSMAKAKFDTAAAGKMARQEIDSQVKAIHARVRAAIEQKDEVIRELTATRDASTERLKHLEETLERLTEKKLLLSK